MILQVERGKHLAANFDWVDFVVRNTDIMAALNHAPLQIKQINGGKYTGNIFGVKLQIEHLKYEHSGGRGYITVLADVRLPFSLGRTYTTASHLYYAINEKTTSIQLDLKLEVTGFMSLYVRIRRKSINNYIDRVCSDIETAAQILASEDARAGILLDEHQKTRIEECRRRIAHAIPLKSSSASKVEASLSVSLVNETIVVKADAVMPDRHFVTARNEVRESPERQSAIKAAANELASINNPAFAVRGGSISKSRGIEFRQAAFEFGHSLYRDYFCGDLANIMPVLLHHGQETFIRLDADEKLEELPWEALHDGKDFLSTKLRFSRILGTTGEHLRTKSNTLEKFGILIVGSDSRGDLPGTTTETQTIANLLTEAAVSKVEVLSGSKADRRNILSLLGSGQFNVLHFSGHSVFNAAYPYQSYLELVQGTRLSLHELDNLIGPEAKPLNLVFLNSCESGRVGLDKTTRRNLSMCRIIRESGVDNVIGMLWNVSDEAAAQVASVFYKFLATGCVPDIVEAMRQTRCKVAMDRAWQDGSWLAPVLYT
jgi:hypothetical protein